MSDEQLVGKDMVVTFHYTLRNEAGEILDSSSGAEPLSYLHGYRNIVPGLEKAMLGKAVGAQFKVTVEPAEGYGEREDEMVIQVPKKEWTLPDHVGAGEVVELQSPEGQVVPAVIVEIGSEVVVLDANHPLAGEQLFFEIELTDIRTATKEELEHGHVHGAGGHEH
ncbi:MAG: peptidylprolyl isomerase [Pseudomonadota bacterium]|jgi:FKBP-type peptidyl-prolyl cis-trans isomerase SlyD